MLNIQTPHNTSERAGSADVAGSRTTDLYPRRCVQRGPCIGPTNWAGPGLTPPPQGGQMKGVLSCQVSLIPNSFCSCSVHL